MLATVKNTFLQWHATETTAKTPTRARSADSWRPARDDACAEKLNRLLEEPHARRQLLRPLPELAPSVEELRVLQRRIAECAGVSKESLSKRILSSSSVSTMASEEDAIGHKGLEAGHMPKARSCGSVSSLCSEFILDDGQIAPILEEEPRIASAKDGSKVEFTHNQVPKTINLAAEFSKQTLKGKPTTMMIRNIPNRYTQREFVRELDDLGFAGTYDFLYLPIDKGTLCNVGYAFVNFLEPKDGERCMEVFHNYIFQRYRKARGKIAAVSIAHLQGLEANLRHYQNSAVNMAPRIKQQRGPLIIPRGQIAGNLC
ncbi:unnamed protein product [Effrenium voratum]|uniref:RRM domain-containing protein n=1 Tax=Effrenium voratum TaxID=2562239 RepID=A0AA36JE24_9DINO|nr:unnamed protein product [Effrenium voratum]|mmetsp:Transcript_49883/g.118940  ORF Transcript_49883/g.118940 Transcript_49883/m.118940 type:complete len:315 (+) Transcript_49883:97-1041(+)